MVEQHEVDAVGHFVEAGLELRDSPFFGPESRIRATVHGDVLTRIVLVSPHVFRSMLASFRRIWLETERCHFRKIVAILKRYCGSAGRISLMKEVEAAHRSACRTRQTPRVPGLPESPLSPGDTIGLWLNTRYAHTGKKGRSGSFTRADFDEHQRLLGKGVSEFYLHSAIFHVGLCYLNLTRIAEQELRRWDEELDVRPSFQLAHAFGEDGVEDEPGGPTVERISPGWSPATEDRASRVQRVLARRAHATLGGLLSSMTDDYARLHDLLLCGRTVADVITELGHPLKVGDPGLEMTGKLSLMHFVDPQGTRQIVGRAAILADDTLLVTEEALEILESQLLAVRRALADP